MKDMLKAICIGLTAIFIMPGSFAVCILLYPYIGGWILLLLSVVLVLVVAYYVGVAIRNKQ